MDRPVSLVSIVFAAATAVASAQTNPRQTEENWKQICARSKASPLSIPVFTHAESEINLQHCDSTALYYGFGHPPDSAAALECGYYQRSHPRQGEGDPFYGPGVLTMLYANGRGVPRNYDLAIRFACESTWAADAEMESRIGHLERLRDTHSSATNFDLCDDATSGLMMGACEFVHQQASAAKRRRELDLISATWSARIKEGFKPLAAAEEAFAASSSVNDVDQTGTGRAAFSLEEEGRLRNQFITNLRRFASGGVPRASSSDYQTADRELNSAGKSGTAWLKLRNAWVDFARVAYPNLSADTVRTQITGQRLRQLQALQPR